MARGNRNNLINNAELTPEERKKSASRAGKASVKAKKERKALKEELLLLLSTDGMQERISIALLQEAQKGNTKAFEVIRDTIGEKPTDKISADLNADVNITIDLSDEE